MSASSAGHDVDASERYHHRRPLDRDFYERLLVGLPAESPRATTSITQSGSIVRVRAGDIVAITQQGAAQVVLMYAWNPEEPRERIWCQETSSLENCYLVPMSRLWSTMPWFHALMTLLEDTVDCTAGPGQLIGRHHFVLDGWEVPAVWIADGGDPSVPSGWESIDRLLDGESLDRGLHRDHVALFRKVAIDPETQEAHVLPSDAHAGDRVVFYAEKDVNLALVPSPYRSDGITARELDGSVEPVGVDLWASGVTPLGWPYPGVPYPDIAPYVAAIAEDRP